MGSKPKNMEKILLPKFQSINLKMFHAVATYFSFLLRKLENQIQFSFFIFRFFQENNK